MATIQHQLVINAPAATVYEAIATAEGVSTWWDQQTPRHSDRGLVLEHSPGPEHGIVKLLVIERTPNTRVEWECISTHPSTSPASAWTGTHFIFNLAALGPEVTALEFQQTGYDDGSSFFNSNREAWSQVLQNLKRVAETLPT